MIGYHKNLQQVIRDRAVYWWMNKPQWYKDKIRETTFKNRPYVTWRHIHVLYSNLMYRGEEAMKKTRWEMVEDGKRIAELRGLPTVVNNEERTQYNDIG